MRENFLRYYPLNLPHRCRAALWHCTAGYRDFAVSGSGLLRCVTLEQKLRGGGSPRKIAFAADLHYGGRAPERRLIDELAQILDEAKPDMLLLGGDTVADACELDEIPAMLRRIGGTIPVKLAVPGNWERGKRWLDCQFYRDLFAQGGFRYLSNEVWSDDAFNICGCDDIGYGEPVLPDSLAPGRCNILLEHRPDGVIALDENNALNPFDIVLCGHTHGGQIRLPFYGALATRGNYGTRFSYGLFRRGSVEMFVTSGVNHRSFPLRLGCRREIVFLNYQ